MDTPSFLPFRWSLPRWQRVAVVISLILLVQGTLAYLLTWIDPAGVPALVPLRIRSYPAWSVPQPRQGDDAMTRAFIRETLDGLASRRPTEPTIVYLSGIAMPDGAGRVVIVPSDGTPGDEASWLPLREVLEKLKACPSQNKLLVFEWTPPPALDRVGFVDLDVAARLPAELDAVPDADRLVLCPCSPGQRPHHSDELGQSVFAHYFREGLLGQADGYGSDRDSRVSTAELTAFVQARVDRWVMHNRGERQTPTLFGTGSEFTVGAVDSSASGEVHEAGEHAFAGLIDQWQERDALYASGDFRKTPRRFQQSQALPLQAELTKSGRARRLPNLEPGDNPNAASRPEPHRPEAGKAILDEQRRVLDQRLALVKQADAESVKKRFIDEVRAKVPPSELDAAVFAHVLADPRLDPGTLRMFDQLLHPAPTSVPRTAEGLCVRQLADLAMRVEVQAWPRDLVEVLLRCTEVGERAYRQTPRLPGYFALLEEPALTRHEGEVRTWTRGYANPDEARRLLLTAHDQFDRLMKLNERWDKCGLALDEAMAELPWYLDALEAIPELREPWQQAAESARALADAFKQGCDESGPWAIRVERLSAQVAGAEKELQRLQQHRQALHAPFTKDAIARLDRQCQSPNADAGVRQQTAALLSVGAPVLRAVDRATLWKALHAVSRRLNDETLALDRQDDDARRSSPAVAGKAPLDYETRRAELRARCQLALLELAGVSDRHLEPLRQCMARAPVANAPGSPLGEVGRLVRALSHQEMIEQWRRENDWRAKERLAWPMPPLAAFDELDAAKTSPTLAHLHGERDGCDRWLLAYHRYQARDYQGLNFESSGIFAARKFHAARSPNALTRGDENVRLNVTAVAPLTENQPYAYFTLEVNRLVPPGSYGPVELRFHRADDVWLDVAPASATLPALAQSTEARALTERVPLRASRLPRAERTGLPAPLGFLVEARFEGRSYHHLVAVPIVPRARDLQILVSADPNEPAPVNEIGVRPGKVKQPHFVFVRNLTNRPRTVHVEVRAGEVLVCNSPKLLTVEPDGVRKVRFVDSAEPLDLRGPLTVRVLDAERSKILAEQSLRVNILAPRDYVTAAEATYVPGREGNNRWAVVVLASKPVVGPAITAQLVLPVQRIPGLLSIGGGTLHAELPSRTQTPRLLVAEGLRLAPSVIEEGPVYLHIDGVPRAFVYRTTFSRGGQPSEPKPDDRPAVRLFAPLCVKSGVDCLAEVEVDNAPRGARLEVALGRVLDNNAFTAEIVREFGEAKKRRIGLASVKDALVFDATIADWTATFDTRAIIGPRELQARLIDAAGREIANSRQSLVIDNTPPIARIAPTPAPVKKGTQLLIQAEGVDPESGVAQVVFFHGKPDKGEIPPSAPRFKAVAANREGTRWSAKLDVPAGHTGPLVVSVQVVNHAGMAAIDTVTLDVTDNEPGKTGPGEIRGKVVEGPRPQPNLIVTLIDERGKEVARTRTLADGAYVFQQVAPGQYRVICVKPESQRRAILGVTVEPGRSARGDLSLSL